jgi:hypothetical protein
MRRFIFTCVIVSAAALLSSAPAYAQASGSSLGARLTAAVSPSKKPPPKCATVKSQLGWKGTICATWVEDVPKKGPDVIHAIFSFMVLRGQLQNISGASMYLRQCTHTGSCSSVRFTAGPSKNTSGTTAELTIKAQKIPPDHGKDQARINTPCITWSTHHQFACHKGLLESAWAVSN